MSLACAIIYLTQVWATNTATLVSEVLPAGETATVMGMMGTAGSLGGALFAQCLGVLIARAGYPAAFLTAGALYPLAATALIGLIRLDRRPGCPAQSTSA